MRLWSRFVSVLDLLRQFPCWRQMEHAEVMRIVRAWIPRCNKSCRRHFQRAKSKGPAGNQGIRQSLHPCSH